MCEVALRLTSSPVCLSVCLLHFLTEPVVDVSITSNLLEAVEFNSTVILTCNAKGSSLSYTWLNSSAPMAVDGKHVVQNGSQLIINEVLRTDLLGPITCTAKNLLESSTSAAFNLTVNCKFTKMARGLESAQVSASVH